MGVAAYNRASMVISERINHEFMEDKGHRRKQLREQMVRAEQQIEICEQFCRDAQALYCDAIDPGTRKSLLTSNIEYFWQKKKRTKKFKQMRSECETAHIDWVHSDHRHSFEHLTICRRKAKAWKTLLEYLNTAYKWPFEFPPHI